MLDCWPSFAWAVAVNAVFFFVNWWTMLGDLVSTLPAGAA